MNNKFCLSPVAVKELAKEYNTPLLILSLEQLRFNYKQMLTHLPNVKICYAVKANPDEGLIAELISLGSNFDVASDGEMLELSKKGVMPDRMVYANPVKTINGLKTAKQLGVNKFTFDSESEIIKIAQAVPGSKVLLRIRMDNTKAHVDLNKKFGARPEDAICLLKKAQENGLNAAGLCFHVGSQVKSSKHYIDAIQTCYKINQEAKAEGIDLTTLDIGGGFPIEEIGFTPDIVGMFKDINKALKEYFPKFEIWAEPGRYICGTAVNLITSVIGEQIRNNQQWYFLDEGLYGSFSGIIFDHWNFELITYKNEPQIHATFAGPSCDSLDILFRDRITEPLEIGDVILVPNCGAYTSASATVFNGFAKANCIIWEDVGKVHKK